ncbi:type VI secretion system lipoprotein TssJ [Pantoea sp. GD03673]|uniref:type VI secretion system lipoprotein TssJ n=1 Tax=Pantoea sp. GD03673 TaxID=2975364 RepID=UPI002449144E|nr:type VI secretion system lipoprotein TssJ [Pantoea sp. GD03673]MDH2067445.1 type VI secretion system lipoprotein TssJ [Pantoea sp. GD03673]
MKRTIQRSLPLMFTALVAGCGLTQSITDGTKDVAKAVFYKKVKTVHLEFHARAELNPDEDGMSLATRVQVFTLKDRQAFDKADYNTLISDADHALSADLVAKKQVQIRPQQTVPFTMPMEEQAQFVAIVAQYRKPDFRKNDWRIVLNRDELDPDKERMVDMAKYAVLLKQASN